jgi:hypothetical protein
MLAAPSCTLTEACFQKRFIARLALKRPSFLKKRSKKLLPVLASAFPGWAQLK